MVLYKYGKCKHNFFWHLYIFILVLYTLEVFSKIIIPLAFVGYEMIIANLVLCASLTICHLISNERSWNNC